VQNIEGAKGLIRLILPSLNFQGFTQKVKDFSKVLNLSGFGVFDDEFRLIFSSGIDRAFYETFPRDLIRLQGEDYTWNLIEYSGMFGLYKHYNFEDGRTYTALLFFSEKPAIINDFLDYFCESIVREIVLYRNIKGEFEQAVGELERLSNLNTFFISSKVLSSEEGESKRFLSTVRTDFPLYLLKQRTVEQIKRFTALNYFRKSCAVFGRVNFLGENYRIFYRTVHCPVGQLIKFQFAKQFKEELERAKKGKIKSVKGIAFKREGGTFEVDFYIKPSRELPEEWREVFAVGRDKITENLIKTLQPLLSIVKSKDLHTYLHLKNVARLSGIIAFEMGLDESEVFYVQIAGLVHDIGKIVLPLELITKPQLLSEVEMEMVKLHVKYSCDIVKDLDFLQGAMVYIKQHHERLDGSGYPEALKGEEIKPASHAVILADVLDAMSSDRPYRRKRTAAEIQEEIEIGKNVKYDPRAAEIALKLLQRGLVIFQN
jgi:HD-GYP domain-containing protein (c-di-GMP phosphodiesterase class II)